MSFILDALKRHDNDAAVGHIPNLHGQLNVQQPRGRQELAWPVLTSILILAAVSLPLILKPWQRHVVEPESKPMLSAVQVLGAVDYQAYPVRERVDIASVLQPKPQVHELPLPPEPVSGGIANGEQPAQIEPTRMSSEAAQGDKAQRLGGSQLQALFKQAVASAELEQNDNTEQTLLEVEPLTQKTKAFQDEVPNLAFSAHSYSSDPRKRIIRVNGVELREGDWLGPKVQLKAILPNKVVLEMNGESFSLPALTDW